MWLFFLYFILHSFYNSLVQETLLSKVCTHLLTSSCSVPSPFSKPTCFFFSVPVPSGGMLALPPKVRWKCAHKYSFCLLFLAHCSMSRPSSFSPPTENAHHEIGSDNRSERVNAKNRFVTKVTSKKNQLASKLRRELKLHHCR